MGIRAKSKAVAEQRGTISGVGGLGSFIRKDSRGYPSKKHGRGQPTRDYVGGRGTRERYKEGLPWVSVQKAEPWPANERLFRGELYKEKLPWVSGQKAGPWPTNEGLSRGPRD